MVSANSVPKLHHTTVLKRQKDRDGFIIRVKGKSKRAHTHCGVICCFVASSSTQRGVVDLSLLIPSLPLCDIAQYSTTDSAGIPRMPLVSWNYQNWMRKSKWGRRFIKLHYLRNIEGFLSLYLCCYFKDGEDVDCGKIWDLWFLS